MTSKCTAIGIILFTVCMQDAHAIFRILALMPYSGKSHFDFAEILFEELARRGNDVTVLSHFPKKTPPPYYHDISIAVDKSDGVHGLEADAVVARPSILTIADFFRKGLHQICIESLSHLAVQKLLNSSDHYDLVITEMFNADCFFGFVAKFNASLVLLRTSTLSTWLADRVGSPDNPSYIPGTTSGNPSHMDLLQRVRNTVYYVGIKMLYWYYARRGEEVARRYFGEQMPSLSEIARNASLVLVNSHFVNQYARPLTPNIKEVAGLHVRVQNPLPDDLSDWMAGGSAGTIYLCLGSMLRPKSPRQRRAFLGAFARLAPEYRVLMKWGEEVLEEVPKNVRIVQWAPQNDVLHHPNMKLFITHGGMLGTVEAVHAGVPMIVIPFFGDQLTNAPLLEERGLAIVLKYQDITEHSLMRALEKVLYDPGYADRAKRLSSAFRERPIPPLEEAAFWVEYVARHRGSPATAQLTRSPSMELSWYQYLLLDVLAVLLLGLLIAWMVLKIFLKLVVRIVTSELRRRSTRRVKKS